jgi:hypothetical protein
MPQPAWLSQTSHKLNDAGCQALGSRPRPWSEGGRKPIAPDDPRVQTAKKMHADKSLSIGDICKTLQISRATFYRYLAAT